ncbi:MAG: hypothetical protein ACJ74O_17965, partial [Frankiaceae bacterium]
MKHSKWLMVARTAALAVVRNAWEARATHVASRRRGMRGWATHKKMLVLSACVAIGTVLAIPVQDADAAASGSLGFASIEGFWIAAGGPPAQAATAAAITGAESAYQPGIIQAGQPYSLTGWGLWQITPGDSESTYCVDYRQLDPWNNAEAAVAKYRGAGNSFSPWTTYQNGAYRGFLPSTPPAPQQVRDPGQYVPINSAPSGTHNSSSPGATCGPQLPALGYVFWKGTNGDLYEAQGAANGALSGPYDRGMGPMGSAPSVGVDGNKATYVYWKGTNGDLIEAYWNGSSWVGPFNRGMGPLGSAPTAAVTAGGYAYVFWKGTNGDLYEAQG